MTINFRVLKGDLNGKIVVLRFFFCRVYLYLNMIIDQYAEGAIKMETHLELKSKDIHANFFKWHQN